MPWLRTKTSFLDEHEITRFSKSKEFAEEHHEVQEPVTKQADLIFILI